MKHPCLLTIFIKYINITISNIYIPLIICN